MSEMRIGQALNLAMDEMLAEDDSVIVFGEDVAAAGGPFGVTRGLLEKHGPNRVKDTPISEATIVSAAVGAALTGLKPVVEIMFMDFIAIAMDGIVNQAAKARFMFGGQKSVPMVIRCPHGGGVNAGPQHSQCLEAWFAHIPGLKVVVPSSASEAYDLLKQAIQDPDPVIFIENKNMYPLKGTLDEAREHLPFGKARIVRPGTDVTIVTYGAAVETALAAARDLERRQIEAEVIDLRTVQPWDEETVLASLSRTHRLVVLHEAVSKFGVGAEIAARMADIGFDELDAPIVRVGAPFMPVPFAKSLEEEFLPASHDVVQAVEKVLA